MLPFYLFCVLFVGPCAGQPVPAYAPKLQKRSTPLANNPGAAIVFTIAIVLCLIIIIWAMRKHYQQKYAGNLPAQSEPDKTIPEALRPGPHVHRTPTSQQTYAENAELPSAPAPVRRMTSHHEAQTQGEMTDRPELPGRSSPSTYTAYNPNMPLSSRTDAPTLPPRPYDRDRMPSRFSLQEAP